MTRGWKVAVIVLAAVGVVSTPLFWLLDGPGAGQLVGASVQAGAGVAALVWAWFQQSGDGPHDTAVRTGAGDASGGGTAVTGVKRPQGRGGGSAGAQDTGNATATGDGSRAVTGIDYT